MGRTSFRIVVHFFKKKGQKTKRENGYDSKIVLGIVDATLNEWTSGKSLHFRKHTLPYNDVINFTTTTRNLFLLSIFCRISISETTRS